jgi:CheY-like chemotaxis protein
VEDDRATISGNDQCALIVEDDPIFARILLDAARESGFKGVVTLQGSAAVMLAREFQPRAVLLDLTLPDVDGWAVLDQLKRDADTRHIPVHILSGKDARERALRQGAFSYLVKPVARERLVAEFARMHSFNARTSSNLLIIEDNESQRRSLVELLAADDVSITQAASGAEALAALSSNPFDCVVLDLTLPDVTGFELLGTIGEDPNLRNVPVVVYTGKELSRKEVTQLRRLAQSVIVKDARSPERLLDETALFLHRRVTRLSQAQRRMLAVSYDTDNALAGKKVLVIDDDVRNIFALTTVLERHQMTVCFSENGKDGIEMLNQAPDIDIVLMDIMMPEMDGYDTTRAIRADPRFSRLPIITLTAKAMKGDREKCIEAGASDYITKPVDTGRLISLLRVWLTPRLGAVA